MSVDLKKRFDRIVEILIQLQSKRVVRAQELADRFEVSLRTIYRDIKSLEQAGVPIIGEAGAGYSIMDGYKLPPVSFSKEEALSFVATEKLTQKFLDKESAKQYGSAMLKIKSILKNHDKDLLSTVENQIIMREQSMPAFLEHVPHALSSTLESISHQKQLIVKYQGIQDDEARQRAIEPIGIYHDGGFWYIVAYCLYRNDFRQFRSDRIQEATLTDTNFNKKHISIAEYIEKHRQTNHSTTHIRLLVEHKLANHLKWERKHYGFVSEKQVGDSIEMIFQSRDIVNEFPRWLMMFADFVKIIEPDELKRNLNTLLQRSMENQSN